MTAPTTLSYNFKYVNNSQDIIAPVLQFRKPEAFKTNLQNKRMRIQKFYLNNSAVPCFIPERIISQSDPIYSVSTDCATNVKANNTLSYQSLKYYIILRDRGGVMADIRYLLQPNINNLPAFDIPISPITSNQYYSNPYYHYFDFTHFLSVIIQEFTNATFASLGSNPTYPYQFYMNSDNTFSLFVPATVGSSTLFDDYYFEFSPELIQLFPFKNVKTSYGTHRLVFGDVPLSIDGNTYYSVSCKFYDTIFPFMQLLFVSKNIRVNPVSFLNNQAFQSNIAQDLFDYAILTYDIGTNQFNDIYNYYAYVNANDSLFVNFSTDTSDEPYISIELFLRMRNDVLVPYSIRRNELVSFTLDLYSEGRSL